MNQRVRLRLGAAIAVPIALLIALLAWGVSSPPGSSPDDDYHMASIWCAGGDIAGRCEAETSADERRVPAYLLTASQCFAFHADRPASCDRREGEMLTTKRGNWYSHAYPPGFYTVMSVFVGPSIPASVVLMRSFNALLYVGTLTALFFLLPRRLRPPLVWGAIISIVPLGMFLVPSTNPSSWAILSASGLWVATWGLFEAEGRRRWLLAAFAVLLLVIGASARADAAAYGVLALVVGTALGWRRTRASTLAALVPLILVVIAALFFVSVGQSAIVSGDTAVHNKEYATSTLIFMNAKLLPQLWAGALGTWGLGWLDTLMPGAVFVTTIGLFSAFAFWGLRRGGLRKWLSLGAVGAALIVVPMYILVHDGIVVGTGVQPRYIYPLMIMFLGVSLVGFSAMRLEMKLPHMIVVVIGLAVANGVALHVNLRRYVTGVNVQSFNLNRPIDWWWNAPVSPMAVWGIGTLAFTVALAMLAWAALASSYGERRLQLDL